MAWNLAFAAVWLRLYAPSLAWIARTVAGETHRLNLGLLVVAAALLAWRARRATSLRAIVTATPHLAPAPLAIALAATAVYLLNERFLDVSLLSAACFGV